MIGQDSRGNYKRDRRAEIDVRCDVASFGSADLAPARGRRRAVLLLGVGYEGLHIDDGDYKRAQCRQPGASQHGTKRRRGPTCPLAETTPRVRAGHSITVGRA